MRFGVALVVVVFALLTTAADSRATGRIGECTVASPPAQATVEARMAYAADFCELLSHALGGDVFHAAVIVTPERLWHFPGTDVSCRLHFRRSGSLTVHNSTATCRWLASHAAGWQLEKGGSNA